jgi:hypothetical protein
MRSGLRVALIAGFAATTGLSAGSPAAAAGFHGGGGGFHGGGGGGFHGGGGGYHGGSNGGYHGGYGGYHGDYDGHVYGGHYGRGYGGYYGRGFGGYYDRGGYYGRGYGGYYGSYGYYGGFGFGDFLFGAALFGTALAVASNGPDYIYTPGYGYDYAPPVYAAPSGANGYGPDGSYYAPGRYPPQDSYPAYPAARDAYQPQNGAQVASITGGQTSTTTNPISQGIESPVDQCARAAEQAAGSRGGFARVTGIDHVDPAPHGARVRGALAVTRDQDDRSTGQSSHFDCTASYGRITELRLS